MTDPLDLQQLDVSPAACVRLLNSTGSVGCATPPSGLVVPLEQLLTAADLERLSQHGGQRALLMAPELFTAATVREAQERMGASLSGILVLTGLPPSGAQPTESERELARERFPFAIVLLDEADSARVLSAIGALGGTNASTQSVVGAAARPLVRLRYPMHARGDSRRCLGEGSCLPLGGQSVWGALPTQLSPGAPVALLAAQIDGTSFFYDTAPAADAAVSGTVALLAAVAAVAASPSLLAQLPSLPATPAFALFTGEAWGGLGSRRFVADIASFNCSRPRAPAAAPPAAAPDAPPPPPPPPPGCASPYKPDLRFEALRAPEGAAGAHGSAVRHVLQLGPVGAAAAGGALVVRAPAQPSARSRAVAEALHTSATLPLRDAAGAGLELPAGPAAAFVDAALVGAARAAQTGVAALVDFEGSAPRGTHGTRFDTRETLNATLVCAAATTAARAWWRLAGGVGLPAANCSLVDELLDCLLLPGGCRLATELEIAAPLHTHYAGVFVATPERTIVAPTAEFARRLLRRQLLAPLCDGAQGCEPTVALHDAYATGLEYRPRRGTWRVLDANQSLWAESNWPSELSTVVWPSSPSALEGGLLLGLGLLNALLTYVAVLAGRNAYDTAYKRL